MIIPLHHLSKKKTNQQFGSVQTRETSVEMTDNLRSNLPIEECIDKWIKHRIGVGQPHGGHPQHM